MSALQAVTDWTLAQYFGHVGERDVTLLMI